MDHDIYSRLQSISRESPYDEPTWRTIIGGLLDDFQRFLGAEFVRDSNCSIDVAAPSFVQWIWSKPSCNSLTSTMWSAVLAGNLAEDKPGNVSLTVIITLFLFSEAQKKRLCTLDGKAFIRFSLDQDRDKVGVWKCHGWCEDLWGEWKDFVFPEDA
jgi:hypothetical protein